MTYFPEDFWGWELRLRTAMVSIVLSCFVIYMYIQNNQKPTSHIGQLYFSPHKYKKNIVNECDFVSFVLIFKMNFAYDANHFMIQLPNLYFRN